MASENMETLRVFDREGNFSVGQQTDRQMRAPLMLFLIGRSRGGCWDTDNMIASLEGQQLQDVLQSVTDSNPHVGSHQS